MRNIPKVVQTLITSTPDATRIRDGLTNAIQPTLDFLNGYFSAAADGTLRILRNFQAQGTATFNGITKFTNDITVDRGNLLIYTRATNGVVIVPTGGSPPFYITNPANTSALFLVSDTGVCTAPSFVSNAGFKSWVKMGTYWNTNTQSGQSFFTVEPIVNTNGGGTGSITRKWGPIRSGSVTGITVTMNNGISGSLVWSILKNGSSFCSCTVNSGSFVGYNTFNKGINAFALGDVLTCQINAPAGVNFAGQVDIEIEESA